MMVYNHSPCNLIAVYLRKDDGMPCITPKAEYFDRCIASHLSAYDIYLFECDRKCKEYLLPHHSPAFEFDCCVSHDKDNGIPSITPAGSIVVVVCRL